MTVTQFKSLSPLGTPLIRVTDSGQRDSLASVIALHLTNTGSVFLELPDGRLAIVVTVDGTTWLPQGPGEDVPG